MLLLFSSSFLFICVFFFLSTRRPPRSTRPDTLFPYTTLFRSSLRHEVQARYDALSPHLQRLARLALEDPNSFALETVTSLAQTAEVQPSTLCRCAKEFGYSGFSEMQKIFRLRLIEGAPAYREQIYRHRDRLEATAETDPMALLREFTDASILCLERLKETVDPEALGEAIGMIAGAEHVYVIGQRRAFPIAAYVAYRSEEHTSELQSLMRLSSAVFCLKKK